MIIVHRKIGKVLEDSGLPLQIPPSATPTTPLASFTKYSTGEEKWCFITFWYFHIFIFPALESLGFGSYYQVEVKRSLTRMQDSSIKKEEKASSRLENLGIPEEELLRQQQELFAKVSNTY